MNLDFLKNDKTLVIIAVIIIVETALGIMGAGAKEIANSALSGLFGVAVGRALGNNDTPKSV